MKTEEQLELWLKGESVHNEEKDECCPDFSCCEKHIITDQETKEKFYKAYCDGDEETMMDMLGMFLGGMLSCNGMRTEQDSNL